MDGCPLGLQGPLGGFWPPYKDASHFDWRKEHYLEGAMASLMAYWIWSVEFITQSWWHCWLIGAKTDCQPDERNSSLERWVILEVEPHYCYRSVSLLPSLFYGMEAVIILTRESNEQHCVPANAPKWLKIPWHQLSEEKLLQNSLLWVQEPVSNYWQN